MKLTFYGATQEVTGSCHIVECGGRTILVDCGLIQGKPVDEKRNYEQFPFDVRNVDAVVLTHSHIDHSGRLPLLAKRGFRGPIYTQNAARDLCRIMLKDAGFLNEKDVQWENKKRQRKGLEPIEPLYSMAEAEAMFDQFEGLPYDEKTEILPGVSICLRDAGHILGSAIVEMWLVDGGHQRKLVFSGDLGHRGAPILEDPAHIKDADVLVMEGTYGNRLHRTREATEDEIGEVIEKAYEDKGNILIPAFAVGRSQDLLYLFSKNYDRWKMDRWQIFLDSPMAIEATEVYASYSNLYDDDMLRLMREKKKGLLPNLHFTRSPEESMKLNNFESGAIIIAGSGMCTGGRIRHHFKHNLWRRDCHIIIVGFQVEGTPGRALVNGAEYVRILGETIKVRAQVHTIGGLSAHADQQGLSDWYGYFDKRPLIALVHGELDVLEELSRHLHDKYSAKTLIPKHGQALDLIRLN